MLIYMVFNTINGHFYIGKTKGLLQRRWKQHVAAANSNRPGSSKLLRAIRKYGAEAFQVYVVKDDITTVEELNEWEKTFIAMYRANTFEWGYNICKGGEGFTGKHGENWYKAMRGRTPWNKGKTNIYSEDTKKAIAEGGRGRIPWNKGKTMSEEFRRKCSHVFTGRPGPQTGKPISAEVRAKISATLKAKGCRPSVEACRLGGKTRHKKGL